MDILRFIYESNDSRVIPGVALTLVGFAILTSLMLVAAIDRLGITWHEVTAGLAVTGGVGMLVLGVAALGEAWLEDARRRSDEQERG